MDNTEKLNNLNNEITLITYNLDDLTDKIHYLQDQLTILQENVDLLIDNLSEHGDIVSVVVYLQNI
jgi:hypothetical protein